VKRILASVMLVIGIIALTATTSGVASAAPQSLKSAAAAPTGYNRCPSGRLCLFNNPNGTGDYCTYSQSSDADTVAGCRFLENGWEVRSVWNRQNSIIQFYTWRNYSHPINYAEPGNRGNAPGTYQIRSYASVG
jgi:hypothetical protein